jgi:hypothetical protein
LAKEAGPDGPTAKDIRAIDASLAELKTWLGELSAADRQAPACYATSGTTLRTRFRAGTSPDCQPLARPNRQFFNASVPRSAAQVVIIGLSLIQFGGHLPKGGYDGQNGIKQDGAAGAAAVHRGVHGRRGPARVG